MKVFREELLHEDTFKMGGPSESKRKNETKIFYIICLGKGGAINYKRGGQRVRHPKIKRAFKAFRVVKRMPML